MTFQGGWAFKIKASILHPALCQIDLWVFLANRLTFLFLKSIGTLRNCKVRRAILHPFWNTAEWNEYTNKDILKYLEASYSLVRFTSLQLQAVFLFSIHTKYPPAARSGHCSFCLDISLHGPSCGPNLSKDFSDHPSWGISLLSPYHVTAQAHILVTGQITLCYYLALHLLIVFPLSPPIEGKSLRAKTCLPCPHCFFNT